MVKIWPVNKFKSASSRQPLQVSVAAVVLLLLYLVTPIVCSGFCVYSKTCFMRSLKIPQKYVYTRLMQVKSIDECSCGTFWNTFYLHYHYLPLVFNTFVSSILSDRLRQVQCIPRLLCPLLLGNHSSRRGKERAACFVFCSLSFMYISCVSCLSVYKCLFLYVQYVDL